MAVGGVNVRGAVPVQTALWLPRVLERRWDGRGKGVERWGEGGLLCGTAGGLVARV